MRFRDWLGISLAAEFRESPSRCCQDQEGVIYGVLAPFRGYYWPRRYFVAIYAASFFVLFVAFTAACGPKFRLMRYTGIAFPQGAMASRPKYLDGEWDGLRIYRGIVQARDFLHPLNNNPADDMIKSGEVNSRIRFLATYPACDKRPKPRGPRLFLPNRKTERGHESIEEHIR